MSGVAVADDPIFGAANTSFAGVAASAVNVQQDGITVSVRLSPPSNAAQ
jgi:hypothetical protein